MKLKSSRNKVTVAREKRGKYEKDCIEETVKIRKKISKKTEKIEEYDEEEHVFDPDVKSNIGDDIILKALDVLKSVERIANKKKKVLLTETKPILLQIECIKIPKLISRKLRFSLPRWLLTDTSEVCLFVSDLKKGKRVDHEPTIQHYEDLLKEKGISIVTSVIPMRQVRVEYDQMEMKRRLLTRYDFFLADARISGLLAHKLGMTFYRKNQLPTPIKMDTTDLKKTIETALHKTVMKLHGTGHTYSLHVANEGHTEKETLQNIHAVLLQLVDKFPGGWNNIRSIHIKHPLSMAIPIYITLKNKNEVEDIVMYSSQSRHEPVEDELSTILGAKVRVFPGGKVTVNVDKSISDERSDDIDEDIKHKNSKRRKLNDDTTDTVINNSEVQEDSDECENNENNDTVDSDQNDTENESDDDDDDDDDNDDDNDDDDDDDNDDDDDDEEEDDS